MRRGSQEQKGWSERSESLGQPIALGAVPGLASAQPVRLVEDYDVPAAYHAKHVPVLLTFREVERDDCLLMQPPVRGVVNDEVTSVNLEELAELEAQLVLPLPDETGRTDDEDPSTLITLSQSMKDQPHLDRLAETHVVGNQPIDGPRADYPMRHVDLVRQRVDIEPPEGACTLIPTFQGMGQDTESKPLGMVGIDANLASLQPLLDRLEPAQKLKRQPPQVAAAEKVDQHLIAVSDPTDSLHDAYAERRGGARRGRVLDEKVRPKGRSQLRGGAPEDLVSPALELDEAPTRFLPRIADPAFAAVIVRGPASPYRQ